MRNTHMYYKFLSFMKRNKSSEILQLTDIRSEYSV